MSEIITLHRPVHVTVWTDRTDDDGSPVTTWRTVVVAATFGALRAGLERAAAAMPAGESLACVAWMGEHGLHSGCHLRRDDPRAAASEIWQDTATADGIYRTDDPDAVELAELAARLAGATP